MSDPDDLFDSSFLAQRAAELLAGREGIGSLYISPDLTIISHTDNLDTLLDLPSWGYKGSAITEVFWEFVGLEPELLSVLSGEIDSFRLDTINRMTSEGIRYLNLTTLPLSESDPGAGLMLLVEVNDQDSRLRQRLTQDRNELRLLQLKLAEANDRLERLNYLKSVFLSMVAHDLRGPLAGILGYAQLLRMHLERGLDGSTEYQFIEVISDQVSHMNRLIGDMLDLDQIEKGLLKIRPENCNLAAILANAGRVVAETAAQKGIDLNLPASEPGIIVYADPERIAQIYYNLLSNALKYTLEGGQVTVSAWEDGDWGVFRVQDTGVGMTEEDLEELFQLYYRTSQARDSKVTGTGIGLYIVKNILDAHGGTIDVKSRPKAGSAFTVRLPRSPKKGMPLA